MECHQPKGPDYTGTRFILADPYGLRKFRTRTNPIRLTIAHVPSRRMKPYCRSMTATAVSPAEPTRFMS